MILYIDLQSSTKMNCLWNANIYPSQKSFRYFFFFGGGGGSIFVTLLNFMPTTFYMRLHQSFVNTLTCFSFVISVKQNDKVWKHCRKIENTSCRWFLTNGYSVVYGHTRYPKTITTYTNIYISETFCDGYIMEWT